MRANDFHKFTEDLAGDVQQGKTVALRGIVISGSKEAAGFTELPWVKKQFIDKLGVDAYPGTFNIMVLPSDREKLDTIRKAKGITITPADTTFCAGKAFPALIGGRIRGAAVVPLILNYPQLQLEIVSSCNVRQTLDLRDGDLVDIEVCLIEASQE